MVKRFLSYTGLLLVMVIVTAGASPAADFSLYVGGIIPGTVDYMDEKASLDNSPVIGLRFSSHPTSTFVIGLEHTLAISPDFLFPGSMPVIGQARGFIYNSNLLYDSPLTINGAVPYLTAGAGLVHQYGDANMPIGTQFAFNYGGGLKFPRLSGPVGLRFDLRGYRLGMISSKVNMFEISAGIMFSIGRDN
jgi:hypothetical protein